MRSACKLLSTELLMQSKSSIKHSCGCCCKCQYLQSSCPMQVFERSFSQNAAQTLLVGLFKMPHLSQTAKCRSSFVQGVTWLPWPALELILGEAVTQKNMAIYCGVPLWILIYLSQSNCQKDQLSHHHLKQGNGFGEDKTKTNSRIGLKNISLMAGSNGDTRGGKQSRLWVALQLWQGSICTNQWGQRGISCLGPLARCQ